MAYKNIEDQRAAVRRHYRKHPDDYKERRRQRRSMLTAWLAEYKATLKCSTCAENHPACLDFHHEGNKAALVSALVRNTSSIDKLKAEIAKCIVLCANCHRKLHYPTRGLRPA